MSEFQRIGAEVFVLIDSERNSENEPLRSDREGFLKICMILFGEARVFITRRKATENYLSNSAIKAVKGEKYRALEHYEKLETVDPAWAKSENWMIADAMDFDDLKNTDLGQFLLNLQKSVEEFKNLPR